MSNQLKLRKIPLFSLIQMLVYVYDRGVQYIDIVGVMGEGEEEDTLGIIEHAITETPSLPIEEPEIDDENLNQLI